MKYLYALTMLAALVGALVLAVLGSEPSHALGLRPALAGVLALIALTIGFWASCQIDSEDAGV